jgi:cytochrome d ubiquinol oxidase subunit I
MDALVLARLQFAANISFHILFPTITIALGWVLLFFRWRWLRTHQTAWLGLPLLDQGLRAELRAGRGQRRGDELPVRHQLAGLHGRVGNIAGPLLAYEVLTAFFLEATFLGVMLFGRNAVVSERVHTAGHLPGGLRHHRLARSGSWR